MWDNADNADDDGDGDLSLCADHASHATQNNDIFKKRILCKGFTFVTFFFAAMLFLCIWINTVRKFGFLRKKNGHKIPHPLNSTVLALIFNIHFPDIYFAECTRRPALIKIQKYICQFTLY